MLDQKRLNTPKSQNQLFQIKAMLCKKRRLHFQAAALVKYIVICTFLDVKSCAVAGANTYIPAIYMERGSTPRFAVRSRRTRRGSVSVKMRQAFAH